MQINLGMFETQEVTYLLNTLAEKPYKEVAGLISKIHTTATKQIADFEKAKTDGSNGLADSDTGRR